MEILVHHDSRHGDEPVDAENVRLAARSEGIGAADDAAVRDTRDHPVPGFSGTDRPTGQPSFSHRVRDGRHYLSRGTPTSDGEWITTVVLEPTEAGPWDPAQAFFSSHWPLGDPDQSDVALWDGLGEHPGAMNPDRLRFFLLAEPWAEPALPAVLTMLDDAVARRRRLALRYSDLRRSARVVAALCQLLTEDEAWGLEFSLPSVEPDRRTSTVFGIHTELTPEWDSAHSDDLDAHVLDLETRTHSSVVVTEAARRHAQWFTSAPDEDLPAALDAVRLSRTWARRVDSATAARAVEALTEDAETTTVQQASAACRVLAGLARVGGDELDGHADALAALVLRAHDPGPGLVVPVVDALIAVHGAEAAGAARTLARALLELTAVEAAAITTWEAAVAEGEVEAAPEIEWPDDAESEQIGGLIAETAARCSDSVLVDYLRLVGPLHPAPPLFEQVIDRAADRWLHHPDQMPPGPWAGRTAALRLLAPQLLQRFDDDDLDALHELRGGVWTGLASEVDDTGLGEQARERLAAWLGLPTHLAAGDEERRDNLQRVAEVLPERAWVLFLGTGDDMNPEELIVWVRCRRRIEHSLAEEIVHRLGNTEAEDHGRGRPMISALAELAQIDVEHDELRSWIDNDHRVRKLWQRAHDEHDAVPNPALVTLADHHREVVHLDHGEIVDAIHGLDDAVTATRIAEPDLDRISDLLRDRLDEELRHAQLPALAAALRLMELPDDHWWALAKDALDEVWDDRALEAVRTELATKAMHLVPEQRRQLALYQQDQADGRLGRGLRRTGVSLAELARAVFRRR